MLKELEYPFDNEYILKKIKSMRRTLLSDGSTRLKTRIAVLGGSTTHEIIKVLDVFLLNYGIEAEFYESEYAQYWQDAMFGNEQLMSFKPDLIYIHTSNRNITTYPSVKDEPDIVNNLLDSEYNHFAVMWEKLADIYHCPIIQNNFEMPFYRLLGNKDASDIHGRVHFITSLNEKFYQYAQAHENFYINDINYISSCYGLDKWADPFFWHMYKYALCLPAIPVLAFNLSNIIKSLFGKNKKSLVLDLDNTLWGGVVGDDGVENLEIGQETSMGQVYSEIQTYIKAQKDIGVMLNISSKNDKENAIAGLEHPDCILKPDDFIFIKSNWEPKSENIAAIASQMNILPESMVFVDDNPAEQEIVKGQIVGIAVPKIGTPEQYIRVLDHSGFFEVTEFSEDDKKRNEMYKENAKRLEQQMSFADYGEYLISLKMSAVIRSFESMYMARIAQLTNKSNQFNLTTRRYTQSEIEDAAASHDYITLYGKLEDKFGDNGVVSVVIGHKEQECLHIDLWIMSCRVLKRDMEYAMMDTLVENCIRQKIKMIKGYYYPTAKNHMVQDFYSLQGFDKCAQDAEGNTVWKFDIADDYQKKNHYIEVNNNSEV